jgi:hypothetical protein
MPSKPKHTSLFAAALALWCLLCGPLVQMRAANVAVEFFYPPTSFVGIAVTGTLAMTASTHEVSCTGVVPVTGSITAVGFRVGTITTSDTLQAGIETLDATGNPSGTQYGGSAVGTGTPSASTMNTITLGTAATAATAGDKVAIRIKFSAYVAGSLNISISSTGNAGSAYAYNNRSTDSGTAWTKSSSVPLCAFSYSGTYYPVAGWMPLSSSNSGSTFNSGSTPDERALYFTLPFNARIKGCFVYGGASAAGADWDCVLYDTDGTTALRTVSVDGDATPTFGASTINQLYFSSSYTTTRNVAYRLSLKPTTATNIRYSDMSVLSVAFMDALPPGAAFYNSTRVNAGSWTEGTSTRTAVHLIIDQVDDGAGGGGGSAARGFVTTQ